MKLLFAALFAIACSAPASSAQDPVKWTLAGRGALTVARGSVTPIKLTAKIDKGWHVYSITQPRGGPFAMSISMLKGSPSVIAGPVISPTPEAKFDSSFRMITETYSGVVTFAVPLKAPADPGTYSSTIKVRYQACSARFCLPPRNALFPLTFEVK